MLVALINTNRMQPPVAPMAGPGLHSRGAARGRAYSQPLDLCWEDDPKSAIEQFFKAMISASSESRCVTPTTAHLPADQSFIPEFIRTRESCPGEFERSRLCWVVSDSRLCPSGSFPSQASILESGGKRVCAAPACGASGEETALPASPNLIWRQDGQRHRNRPSWNTLAELLHEPKWVWITSRYFRQEGRQDLKPDVAVFRPLYLLCRSRR